MTIRNIKWKGLLMLALLLFSENSVQASDVINFDKDWRFILADSATMSAGDYNDGHWRRLSLPHDWSIEGDFSASAPCGNSGGALPGGTGWYRKHFNLDDKDKDSRYFIYFDGVYMNSEVWINGTSVGRRPYGFISFEYEITPYINKRGDNTIAVRVDNKNQPNCRWYSGSGIYRHVYLKKSSKARIDKWGVHVDPVLKSDGTADIKATATVDGQAGKKYSVVMSVINPSGKTVSSSTKTITLSKSISSPASMTPDEEYTDRQKRSVVAEYHLDDPVLWSTESPNIYRLKTILKQGSKVIDTEETTFGIRSIVFDAQKGFFLNGKNMKINGVCNHHDLGSLGAAVNEDALYRQLRILKDMGCNSVRCSHNPPAPELLNMCDTMGIMVQDEAFDMWHRRKTKYDYSLYFDEWHERDLADMMLRDRNHPSIIMWSIGNEVLEQWSSADADTLSAEQANLILNQGHKTDDENEVAKGLSINSKLTIHLADIARRYDNTRPVTAGCNEPSPTNHLFRSGALDVIGFNYHNYEVANVPRNFPGKPFMLSESVSSIQTRGNYVMPSDSLIVAPQEWWLPYTDPSFQCSAYDHSRVKWGNTHEETWDLVKHTPYCAGEYIWTGFDYIGEPTPYGFPARSSYFGIIDLAGFPKDVYYMYQSEWTDKTVLHLFPHWNWIEGDSVDMWCYYNQADEVELFVNGKSQGVRTKGPHDYHVMWRVVFEPGEVKVVSRKNGTTVAEQSVRTASSPYTLRLTADKNTLDAEGNELAFITVEVVDSEGNLCPRADNEIRFNVEGPARIESTDNGNPISMERFKADDYLGQSKNAHRMAFNGKALLIVRGDKTGTDALNVVITAKAPDLKTAKLDLKVK